MIKKFTAAVVLGAIVGAVAYKIKKEYDDKKMLDKELEMLSGNEECGCSCEEECTCENECSCEECECEEESFVDEVIKEVEEIIEEAKEIVYEVKEEVQEVVEEVKEAVEEKVEEFKDNPIVEEAVEKKTAFLDESLEEKQINDHLNEEFKKELDDNSDFVIHKLNTENDELKEERPIQHTIDFKSLDDLEKYKAIVIEKGFVAVKGENQHQLNVLHIAPINKSELLVNVYYLANLAVKNNATYQGWQSRKVL